MNLIIIIFISFFFHSLVIILVVCVCVFFFLQGHKVFAWYDGKLSAADYYVGRVNLLDNAYGYGRATVNLTSIRETDSGWYGIETFLFFFLFLDIILAISFVTHIFFEKLNFIFNVQNYGWHYLQV